MSPDSLVVTILGCGSSGGVPRIGGDWGACDPTDPCNRRRRCSILVRRCGPNGATTVLVDTNADLREQLIDTGVRRIDAVLYTHDHADHTHGIDDLRVAALNQRARVPIHAMQETLDVLYARFGYCFSTPAGSNYPPILDAHAICPGQPLSIDGAGGPIMVMPFRQQHGEINSLGFRFGDIAYSSDVSDLGAGALEALRDVDVWIVDALRYRPHPSHFSVSEALEWIERVEPRQAVLTNMHIDLDYATLNRLTPPHVVPARDGLTLTTLASGSVRS